MSDDRQPSEVRSGRRNTDGIESSEQRSGYQRTQAPYLSFRQRLEFFRPQFAGLPQTAESTEIRHQSFDAEAGYHRLRLRGFFVQGTLDPNESSLDDVYEIIDKIGWSYTTIHVNPFYPEIVREFVANKPYGDDGVFVRGRTYCFTPTVIDQLMATPFVDEAFPWRSVNLKDAISSLTGGRISGWKGFSLHALPIALRILYRVCELNWIPGPSSDGMIKTRLRLLYAVVNHKPVSFGDLVYEQVFDMVRKTDCESSIMFPNLIYQVLTLQHDIPLLPIDQEPIGRGIPILGFDSGTSGPRGSLGLY